MMIELFKCKQVLDLANDFAVKNKDILACGLCGSWARGTPKHNSDIDLCIITKDKELFRKSHWLDTIDFQQINEHVDFFHDKDYGLVWSRHVFLESGIEIEFSFADESWADINFLDEGTKKVVSDGFSIIYDPKQILKKLVNRIF